MGNEAVFWSFCGEMLSFSLAICAVWYFLVKRINSNAATTGTRLNELLHRIEDLEVWTAEKDARITSNMSERSEKGVEARQANRVMRANAEQEAREIISKINPTELLTNPEAQNKAKGLLAAWAQKYPKHAEDTIDALIVEFKAESFAPIIKTVISQALSGQIAPTAQKELWYGIEV